MIEMIALEQSTVYSATQWASVHQSLSYLVDVHCQPVNMFFSCCLYYLSHLLFIGGQYIPFSQSEMWKEEKKDRTKEIQNFSVW